MQELGTLLAACLSEIARCDSLKRVETLRNAILGKNGKITQVIEKLREMEPDQRRRVGSEINSIKDNVIKALDQRRCELESAEISERLVSEFVDASRPARPRSFGKIHPLTKVSEEIADIMSSYGFVLADGEDIETEYFNFTALNMPEHHPARAMHDTFYLQIAAGECGRRLLRTHTSPIQIHAMLANTPPYRFFSIGRVYRNDCDATHTPMFNQVEGLMVDEKVGFGHLKWLMTDFLKKFFGVKHLSLRLRPSFFPFTEPSAEVDVNYDIVNGKMVFGTGDRWLEVAGCGVVHPNVLRNGNVDTLRYQGIAFAFGIDRLTSLKYGISDLREYFESNERWRNTYGFCHVTV
ncbi:MAG: phenylalanine--tRNA ligase subunit alpha [Holosporaceae bacterium]|jgi:phenylalanyl-tRNA synthetase alpha chain|nr:phenylalanine--tRNA ligase subunit alpha [Holosporaceae bacterium]